MTCERSGRNAPINNIINTFVIAGFYCESRFFMVWDSLQLQLIL